MHFRIKIYKPRKVLNRGFYCGKCRKIILDAAHKYCGWCGNEIDWSEYFG